MHAGNLACSLPNWKWMLDLESQCIHHANCFQIKKNNAIKQHNQEIKIKNATCNLGTHKIKKKENNKFSQ
jgi:hypothetical protein